MTTNNEVREAIQVLIERYKDKSMNHTYGNSTYCTLCSLFLQHNCKNCPNFAFNNNDDFVYPCVARCTNFHSLDWENEDHKLVEFWTSVHARIPANDGDYVLYFDLIDEILEIANTFKK